MKKLLFILLIMSPFLYSQDLIIGEQDQDSIAVAFNKAKIVICLDDIDKSFWTGNNSDGSMYFNCFIIDGSNTLTRNIIKEMKIYDSLGSNWTIKPEVNRLRIGVWGNFYSSRYSFDGSVLALGEYTLEILTNDGNLYRRSFELSDLSANIDRNDTFIYSTDYNGKVRSGYRKALNRPTITFFDSINDTLQINFMINDNRVQNAGLAFYDENKKYVGSYEFFYNSYSDQTRIEVNNGSKLLNDGTINSVILKSSSISFESGKKLSDIKKVIVNVYDQENPEIFSINKDLIRFSAKSEMIPLVNKI